MTKITADIFPQNARLISANIYLGEKQEKLISLFPEREVESKKENNRVYAGEFIGELEPCSVDMFVPELNASGYVLVDVYRKQYPNRLMKGHYWIVKAVFCHPAFVRQDQLSKDILDNGKRYRMGIHKLCQSFLFRARAHVNPFFDGGEEPVSGFKTLSLDFDRRIPRINPDGKPVMVWPGEKGVGDKVPLEGKYELSIDQVHMVLEIA